MPANAPRSWPVLGVLPAMRRAPHRAFAAIQARDGDDTQVRLGPRRVRLLSDPETCRALLRQDERDVGKSVFYDILRETFGDGLLTSGGEHWQRRRNLIQPLLTPRAVQTYVPTVTEATGDLLQAWRRAASTGEPVDAGAWAGTLARTVTVRALFGAEAGGASGEMAAALATMQHWTARRFWSLVDPLHYPNRDRARYRKALATVDRTVYAMIERRRANPDGGDDVLARLVRARDAVGGLSARDLRDEATTLYLAGQETTANGLAFALWELARRPDWQARLRDEARSVLGDGPPAPDSARHLPWTRAVVEETLRLHPPVWSIGRQTHRTVEANGTTIPAGTTCVVAQWILHRRTEAWRDPETFDPARFHSGHHPRAFMPFGAGHRACVGRDFALMEMILALALILREVELSDATPTRVDDRALAGLVPAPSPRLHVTPRS